DLGAEKFFHIKCRSSGLKPSAGVIVVTIRALRHHGGASRREYNFPDMDRVQTGFKNVEKHIENMMKFGVPPVVAINYFPGDSTEEIEYVKKACSRLGVKAVVSKGLSEGGEGSTELAEALVEAIDHQPVNFKFLFDLHQPVKEKIFK